MYLAFPDPEPKPQEIPIASFILAVFGIDIGIDQTWDQMQWTLKWTEASLQPLLIA